MLENHVNSYLNALSTKQPQIITCPDVEKALALWVQDMEEWEESVTGPMLKSKHAKFENEFDMPEQECLHGDG